MRVVFIALIDSLCPMSCPNAAFRWTYFEDKSAAEPSRNGFGMVAPGKQVAYRLLGKLDVKYEEIGELAPDLVMQHGNTKGTKGKAQLFVTGDAAAGGSRCEAREPTQD